MTTPIDIITALRSRHASYIGGNERDWGINMDSPTRAGASKLIFLVMSRIDDDREEAIFSVPSEDEWTETGLRAYLDNRCLELRETDNPLIVALSFIDEMQGTTPTMGAVLTMRSHLF